MSFSVLSRRGVLGASFGLAAIAALSACSTTTALSPVAPVGPVMDQTTEALPLVNQARAKKGLPPLIADPITIAAARDQAENMANAGKMAHKLGPEDFGARMRRMKVPLPAAENIASGQRTVEAAVAAWITSPRHYENMMGRFETLGVVRAVNSADGRPYWAMVLGSKPRPGRGSVARFPLKLF
ncbi:CAP domain-containing protein [Rhizobium sp. TRM95796]|uniref:CAP domain-containing protein n=1 Tax=Rhizobium sp. TRM95796 TaxID=2979862 RepID=UPI0021E83D27|nr:CAP domain-containing protein [Rhizobium sp. TRM95796]MCV3765879.1 CAP domain-containing protein [Rhizobium sp. TRM95796]